ncbi:MAG TPA: TonB-dependent receptor, partial [Sphingomonas sp.]
LPPGSLGAVIVAIGNQAGVTIGVADPQLGRLVLRGVRGRMNIAGLLSRLMAGTPATFVQTDPVTYRIIRRPPAEEHLAKAAPQKMVVRPQADIVVTASKRAEPLANYAGSIDVENPFEQSQASLSRGSDALVQQIPVLSSTHLGPGRNKLFIRGVADSSFNGPTQSTVGQYLGDVRLNFNAPDPDLSFYDIRSVEVLEGPQGTLYGAGSLGGIIRLEPTPPDLARFGLSLGAGGSVTAHSAPSGDLAGVVNLPIATDRLALRIVVYASTDGGYIDDPSRRLSDINRTITKGGRATLRFQPAPDWTVDIGGVVQNIDSRDGQYATRGLPPLQRESAIAQPFDNDYSLADIVVHHDIGRTTLVSTTSAVFHDVGSTYDASMSAASPVRYHQSDDIAQLTSETRLSHQAVDGGGWVAGIEILRNMDRLKRTLGPLGSEGAISGTRNSTDQISLYGEATLRFASRWFFTGGGRLGYSRSVGDVLDSAKANEDDQRRHDLSLLPSGGILWKTTSKLSFYGRYQKGFRPGGLSVQASGSERFEADRVTTWETGTRYGTAKDAFSASAAVSYAHWEDIQADLVDTDGLPYTANIGSGHILGLEIRSIWRPLRGVTIDAAAFINQSRLNKPAAAFRGERDATLPNIADIIARFGVRYVFRAAGRDVQVSGSVHYVGRSRLGVGPELDLHQGRYADTAFGLSMPLGRATVSLDATNLFDARGNIFSLGNPFGVMTGNQTTPLRPRTLRLGVAYAF